VLDFLTILTAAIYSLYALSVCICCGVVVCKLLRYEESSDSISQANQSVLANFFLGCGFGLWAISLLQLGLLIVCSGLPPYFFDLVSIGITGTTLYLVRDNAIQIFRAFRESVFFDWKSRLGAILVGGAILVTVCFSIRASLIPLWHGDMLLYAVEAKSLRDTRDYVERFQRTPQYNSKNFIRMNDHPINFIGYMASGLFFSPNRTQDFSLRVALQLQNVILMVVLLGLGLRLGGVVGVLAPVFLLYYHYFGAIIDMAHRESFRVIPVLLCFGFLPLDKKKLKLFSARTALLFSAMLFLWSSHSGSLAIAPVVLLSQVVVLRDWRSRSAVILACALGMLFGASHHLDAYFHTGSLFGYQFWGVEMFRLHPPKIWHSSPPPPPGFSFVLDHLINQWHDDGAIAVVGLLLAIVWVGVAVLRRNRLSVVILSIAIFCFINEIEVLGLMDWIHPRLSPMLFVVSRYRFVIYPLSAVLIVYCFRNMIDKIPSQIYFVLGGLVLVGGIASAIIYWQRAPMDFQVVRDDKTLSYLDPMKSCWGTVLKNIKSVDKNLPVIITDAPMIPWYYTDWDVMTLVDPRLKPALMAKTSDEARAELDKLHVGAIILNKANVISGTAMDDALHNSNYKIYINCIFDVGYIRK